MCSDRPKQLPSHSHASCAVTNQTRFDQILKVSILCFSFSNIAVNLDCCLAKAHPYCKCRWAFYTVSCWTYHRLLFITRIPLNRGPSPHSVSMYTSFIIKKQLKSCEHGGLRNVAPWDMTLIDRCYHWEMCEYFTLSTKITPIITPLYIARLRTSLYGGLKHVEAHFASHTLEWQTRTHIQRWWTLNHVG